MKYEFHPSAKIELNGAVDYYDRCRFGLGEEFAEEVNSTIQKILQFPKAWQKLSANTRRCPTKRFPYGVIYQILEDKIIIIAIMHLKRAPFYWANRLQNL